MAYGELASARNVYSDFARHCVIRMQGPCWYFCALDGYRSNLWAHGGYYCEGTVQVCRPPFCERYLSECLGLEGHTPRPVFSPFASPTSHA